MEDPDILPPSRVAPIKDCRVVAARLQGELERKVDEAAAWTVGEIIPRPHKGVDPKDVVLHALCDSVLLGACLAARSKTVSDYEGLLTSWTKVQRWLGADPDEGATSFWGARRIK